MKAAKPDQMDMKPVGWSPHTFLNGHQSYFKGVLLALATERKAFFRSSCPQAHILARQVPLPREALSLIHKEFLEIHKNMT